MRQWSTSDETVIQWEEIRLSKAKFFNVGFIIAWKANIVSHIPYFVSESYNCELYRGTGNLKTEGFNRLIALQLIPHL